MKSIFIAWLLVSFMFVQAGAQVTQINSNKSLHVVYPLSVSKTILVSNIDSTLWVSDATLGGTVQINPLIKYEGDYALLSGKIIFRGRTDATGSELFSTDGTPGGTGIVQDIYPGTTGSKPAEMIVMGGAVYFSATTAAAGREPWRSNGTNGGTAILKDIVTGTDSSNTEGNYDLYTNGSYLLFAARTAAAGLELWRSDGSSVGTNILMDINTGNAGADSSSPHTFYTLNNLVLFAAKDATHGEEIWKTDGTPGNTGMLKDINSGPGSSTTYEFFPGFDIPVFQSFHTFNNKAYFNASDGTSTGQLWSTDGSSLNTVLLKDVVPGLSLSFVSVVQGVNYPNKFFFPVSDGASSSELWVSDGTPDGTVMFQSFDPADQFPPFMFVPYDFSGGTLGYSLFLGNKFFFMAGTSTEGNELWVCDGTAGGTHIVKDINPGTGDGIDLAQGISYLYTSTAFFFNGTTTGQGNELWRSDASSTGTNIVADIYTNAGNSVPELTVICNFNKVMFPATNGDDPNLTDLYVVDGEFGPIPVTITGFTVMLRGNDALLKWNTAQEVNSKDFTVQRSYDAVHFENIGIVAAAGNSGSSRTYNFTDRGVTALGKDIIYYRFIASDIDGKQATSNVLPLKLQHGTWALSLLTNPVQQELGILSTGATGAVKIAVRDMNGKLVYSNTLQNCNGQITIPVNLQAGVYILVAENNKEVKAMKFVRE